MGSNADPFQGRRGQLGTTRRGRRSRGSRPEGEDVRRRSVPDRDDRQRDRLHARWAECTGDRRKHPSRPDVAAWHRCRPRDRQPLRRGGRIRKRGRRPTSRHDPRGPQRRWRQDLVVRDPARGPGCEWPPPVEHQAEPRRWARVRAGHVPHARRRPFGGHDRDSPSPGIEVSPGRSTGSPRSVGAQRTSEASSTGWDFASARSGWPTGTSSGRTGTVATDEVRL
jgi:hypothetical protein